MIGNVNQPSTNQIMDVDGTLKLNAVDAEAVLADNVVTAAKIADNVVGAGYSAGSDLTLEAASDRIGAAASASGSIATSIDTDGTLKAGAVDVAAVLADGVVTAAKLAARLPGATNLARDPYLLLGSVGDRNDGRVRWYQVATDWSTVAGNPFGGNIARSNAQTGGRKFYLDEMGLTPGDVVSIAVLAYIPSTITAVRVAYAWRDSAGNSISALTGSSVAGANATAYLTRENNTVPANAAILDVYITSISGTGNIDIYAWYILPGVAFPTTGITPVGAADGIATAKDLRAFQPLIGATNLAPDPLCTFYGVSGTPDARVRWYSVSGLSTVASGNAYGGGQFVRSNASTGGRRFWLDELGLQAGDKVSVAIVAYVPSTITSVRIGFTTRDVGGGVISSTSAASGTAGANAVATLKLENATISAATVAVDLFVTSISGTGNIDMYAWCIYRSPTLPYVLPPPGGSSGTMAMREVEAARGTEANLAQRLTVALNDDGTLKAAPAASPYLQSSIVYGRQYLRSWLAQLAKIRYGDTEQAIIAFVGDSWVNGEWRITDPTADWMHAEYGNAGAGFVSGYEGVKSEPNGVSRSRTGTWTDRTSATTPAGRGPDNTDSHSTDTATPAKLAYTATATGCVIHYYQQPDGGDFRWRVDAGGWTTVATDGVAGHATETISGLSDASHTIEIEIEAAGTAGVTLYGVDLQRNAAGVRVHKIGDGGATAGRYLSLDQTEWQDAITALAPDCVVLVFGTNEDSGDTAPASYVANMEALAARVRAALPLCDILYLPPGLNGLAAGTYTMADYVTLLRESAVDNNYAMHDSVLLLGPYADANSRGLWSDTAHVNQRGGRLLVGSLINELLYLP